MVDKPLNDSEQDTLSTRVEQDAGREHEPEAPTSDTKTAEDVKNDAEIQDRFEATDN